MTDHNPRTSNGGIIAAGSSDLELKPREQQVVDMIGAGLNLKATGRALKIAPATVRWHVSNIASRIPGRGSALQKITAWVVTHGHRGS